MAYFLPKWILPVLMTISYMAIPTVRGGFDGGHHGGQGLGLGQGLNVGHGHVVQHGHGGGIGLGHGGGHGGGIGLGLGGGHGGGIGLGLGGGHGGGIGLGHGGGIAHGGGIGLGHGGGIAHGGGIGLGHGGGIGIGHGGGGIGLGGHGGGGIGLGGHGGGVGIAHGQGLGHEQGYGGGHQDIGQDHYSVPHYSYAYGVSDHHTGDNKMASELRQGQNVKGEYSLQEPGGGWRTVAYVADHGGFRANVHRTPNVHPHGHAGGGLGGLGH